jgi:NADH dehydrogenase [ubiquinone] 1 alpha subcomplex assembly factor 7
VSASGVAAKIARRIREEGPLSVAAYMAIALHDPDDGYYARRDPIGAAGDFVTAPETSQVFGELIGLWLVDWWRRSGRPEPVSLAELGPGRGVLMADLLRAAALAPEFGRALRLYLVERSPRLRAEQRRRLGAADPVWIDAVEELPPGPLLLIANEFLDALPIRQFVRGARGWAERLVALGRDGGFVFVAGPEAPAATAIAEASRRRAVGPGDIVEVCPAALALAAWLGARLAKQPGAALFVDYGYCGPGPGATLQAVRRHRPISPLTATGGADLSAHVDFAAFAAAALAAGAEIHGPAPQERFLTALGAKTRLSTLCSHADPDRRPTLQAGVERLLDPAQMGSLFKVVALTSPGLPPPAGFD